MYYFQVIVQMLRGNLPELRREHLPSRDSWQSMAKIQLKESLQHGICVKQNVLERPTLSFDIFLNFIEECKCKILGCDNWSETPSCANHHVCWLQGAWGLLQPFPSLGTTLQWEERALLWPSIPPQPCVPSSEPWVGPSPHRVVIPSGESRGDPGGPESCLEAAERLGLSTGLFPLSQHSISEDICPSPTLFSRTHLKAIH